VRALSPMPPLARSATVSARLVEGSAESGQLADDQGVAGAEVEQGTIEFRPGGELAGGVVGERCVEGAGIRSHDQCNYTAAYLPPP
jgi:hypothetical protein